MIFQETRAIAIRKQNFALEDAVNQFIYQVWTSYKFLPEQFNNNQGIHFSQIIQTLQEKELEDMYVS